MLLIIESDPRTSHRPGEAIRIAAGVGSWKKVDIIIYLREAAVLALGEYAEDLVDEENYTRYLPILLNFDRPIYVQRGAPLLVKGKENPFRFEEIDDAQLASLAAHSTYLLRF